MIRYLEIDSTYRDRTRWPLPGNFEIPIDQTGRRGKLDALDPVSLATPTTCWTSNNFNAATAVSTVTGVVSSPATDPLACTNSSQKFIIETVAGQFQQIKDYYINSVIVNGTDGTFGRVSGYTYMGVNSGTNTDRALVYVVGGTFVAGDVYTICDPTDIIDTSYPSIFVPDGRIGSNRYPEYLLYNQTLNQYRTIIDYNEVTHLTVLDTTGTTNSMAGPVTGWLATHQYCIRKEAPLFFGTVTSATSNTVVLSAGSSTINDVYNGDFLQLTSGVNDGTIRRIIDYDGSTLTATVFPSYSVSPSNTDTLEILGFSYDNANPFSYTGSMVSQQEEVCYEIQLLSLVLPNSTLRVGQGSLISFYPYVHVELTNITSAGAGLKDVLYSNNPNSTRMLFRASIVDVNDPLVTPFIKIDGSGTLQTVKFKINDNLRFSVRLPGGQIYETLSSDTSSPSQPRGNLQLSCLFSLRRV